MDPDPEGHELLKSDTPLKSAEKFMTTLEQFAADWLTTHLLRFEVAIRQPEQIVKAAEAIKRGLQIDEGEPQLAVALAKLVGKLAQSVEGLDDATKTKANEVVKSIMGDGDLKSFCKVLSVT